MTASAHADRPAPPPPVDAPFAGGSPLETAALTCVADLDAAIAVHRDTLATMSVERTTLADALGQGEEELATSPLGSEHHRRLSAAVEQLRVRLRAADSVVEVATRALTDAERMRGLILAAAPGMRPVRMAVEIAEGDSRPQLFRVIEDERMRIARDMHDGPAQLLANLVLKAEIVERLMDHDQSLARAELIDFKAIVRHALEETRQLIFNLRPMTLDDLGLIPTLRTFLADFEDRWHIPCRLQLIGTERRVDPDLEAAVFRIVQEACTNARKHGFATVIEVTVSMSAKRLSATVTDDGRGFDVAATERQTRNANHLGLTSMRERAALSGASLEIASAAGKGTQVRVTVTV